MLCCHKSAFRLQIYETPTKVPQLRQRSIYRSRIRDSSERKHSACSKSTPCIPAIFCIAHASKMIWVSVISGCASWHVLTCWRNCSFSLLEMASTWGPMASFRVVNSIIVQQPFANYFSLILFWTRSFFSAPLGINLHRHAWIRIDTHRHVWQCSADARQCLRYIARFCNVTIYISTGA